MRKLSKITSVFLALIILLVPVCSNFAVTAEAAGKWICTWATSIVDSSISLASVSVQDIIPARSTVRIELKVTTAGEKLRFKFSNEHGAAPVTINDATVAKTRGAGEGAIDTSTAAAITFDGGLGSVTIPKGETMWSDPIDYKTEALDSLSVSLYFANMTYITSAGLANARTFMGVRSVFGGGSSECYARIISSAREVNISASTITYHTTPFLCAIDSYSTDANAGTAVFIGDSTLVNNTYYYFAQKLVNAGITNIGVVNEAVVANKLLSDGTGIIGNLYGDAMIERFTRDAIEITGVKYIFVKIGLNDILHQFSKSMGADVPHYTTQDIINGYKDLIDMAHDNGIKIYFFTKTAWKGYERAFLGQTGDIVWNQKMQDMCDELTRWIKTNKYADGYIDCSPLANPADKYALCPSFTSDGAHLTPVASVALADLIPVSFVGVNSEIKTAAKINKVDPYKEKKQIIYDLEHPEEKTTVKEESTTRREESTTRKEETTTRREEATTAAPSTTAPATTAPATTGPSVEATTVQQYIPQEIVTVPVIADPQETKPFENLGVNPDYNITDTMPEQIGDGAPLAFLLILFAVVIIAGAVLFLTIGRKKQEEFQ